MNIINDQPATFAELSEEVFTVNEVHCSEEHCAKRIST